MRLLKVAALLGISAVAALNQTSLEGRLANALPPLEADLAAQELTAKDYAALERRLSKQESRSTATDAKGEVLCLEGVVAFFAGDAPSSISYFQRATQQSRLGEGDQFTFAMALVRVGDDKRADAILSGLAREHPGKPIYLYWQGRLDYDLRRYDEAVQKLRGAIELDPGSARAWDALGLALDMQGLTEEAFNTLTKAAALNRSQHQPSAWPPNDLGAVCLRMNRLEEAEKALREALQYDPKLPQAHAHLARTLEKNGREAEAVQEYKEALSEDPAAADTYYSLATLYRKLKRDGDAAEMFAQYKRLKQAQPAAGTQSPMEQR